MRVVGYVRISRDEDKESYTSIVAQKKIIEEQARKNGWEVICYYEDDNWSGYSFERPAFLEMLKKLEKDEIDVVIAKDLSRIGRHNALTLLFIEKLKSMNKRLILPNEAGGYDTQKEENDMLGLFSWFNEMYVKDISRKIRSSIKASQSIGKMLIKEHFGYKRSEDDKHALVVSEQEAAIVRNIFKLYLEGLGYRKIADYLNNDCCPTPSQFLKAKNRSSGRIYKAPISDKWTSSQVQRIIKNDIYIGTLRLAKTTKTCIKGKSKQNAESDQFVFKNNHQAVINKDDFDRAQLIAERRKKCSYRGSSNSINLFSGIIICGDCGSYMIAYTRNQVKSYICGRYHKHGSKHCSRHCISERELLMIVKEHIAYLCDSLNQKKFTIDMEKITQKKYNRVLLDDLKKEYQSCRQELDELLLQKAKLAISISDSTHCKELEESFLRLAEERAKHLSYLQSQLKAQNENISVNKDTKQSIADAFERILEGSNPKRSDIELLIDQIVISKDKCLEIKLNANIDSIT